MKYILRVGLFLILYVYICLWTRIPLNPNYVLAEKYQKLKFLLIVSQKTVYIFLISMLSEDE